MRHASAYEDCLSSAMIDISSDKAVFARPIAVLRRHDTAIGERTPRHATRYALRSSLPRARQPVDGWHL